MFEPALAIKYLSVRFTFVYISFHAFILTITPPHSLLAQGYEQNIKKKASHLFLDKKYIAGKTYLSISEESLTKKKRCLEVILSTRTAKSN